MQTQMLDRSDLMRRISLDEGSHSLYTEGGTEAMLRRHFGFRPRTQPAKMISAVLANGAAPKLPQVLSAGQLNVGLTWWICSAMMRAAHEVGSGFEVDGSVLKAQWQALPEHSREIFPEHTRRAIEALANYRFGLPPQPSRLAHALLTDGGTVSWLTEQESPEHE